METLIGQYPDLHQAHSKLAYHYVGQDDDAALEYAGRAVALEPRSTAGYLARARVHLEVEEYELARQDLDDALDLNPQNLWGNLLLAYWHWDQEDYSEAESQLDHIQTLVPYFPRSLIDKAALYREQGQLDQAWKMIHQALAVDPSNPDALWLKANLKAIVGEYSQAQTDLNRILRDYPNNVAAHGLQAQVYYEQERYNEASDAAERALALDTQEWSAHQILTWIAMDNNDVDEALFRLEAWKEVYPDEPYPYYLEGFVYRYDGQINEALESFDIALDKSHPDNPLAGDIHLERAQTYLSDADEEMADEELQSVLETSTDLSTIALAEEILVDPGQRAVSSEGRRILEDSDAGYRISFAEEWSQYGANPPEGYFLSLGQNQDGQLVASLDLFIQDWDPSLNLVDLAIYLTPSEPGTTVEPLEPVTIAGQSGLLRRYRQQEGGQTILGRQYFVAQGDRVAILLLWATEEVSAAFEAEFEVIVSSFEFLP